jgi:hypothetical protein
MTESEEHPERRPGAYDPDEDPDTDAPAGVDRGENDHAEEPVPEGQAEPSGDEPPSAG